MARKKKEIKQDNFYTVRYWMPDKLGLGGTKLLAYAFLYGYSINNNNIGYYYGGQSLMSKATGCSTRQLPRVLTSLADEGLIEIKKAILENGLERNYYRVAVEPLEDLFNREAIEDLRESLKILEANSERWAKCIKVDPDTKEGKRVY